MANRLFTGLSLLTLAIAAVGCAGPEKKLGRGLSNATEFAHMTEFTRATEQETVFNDSPNVGLATGVVRGFDNTVKRTGLGLFEIVTFPFPPYHPVLTKYVSAKPGSPDSYKAGHISDSTFDTDTYAGFSGGEVAPFIPGSRFSVFEP